MRMYDIIKKKRDGRELNYEELKYFINGYCKDEIPDYQVSALLMAIYFKNMTEKETMELTMLMAQSGEMRGLHGINRKTVDKHSTGGVGDKTTLVVGPLVAACGVCVPKMSGRTLGHTGGTIDKLESIPGFKTELSKEEFISFANKTGFCVSAQTGNLVPADKKLYSLRDVTATVDNIHLIASSIMSKKIASGADAIMLDVKVGHGAFMKTEDDAKKLAALMVMSGERAGKKVGALLTRMDSPLGMAVGNSLEVMEAINTLKNKGPDDLSQLCLELSARMLELSDMGDYKKCRQMVEDALNSGKALKKLEEMIELQGGDILVIDDYSVFKQAKIQKAVFSDKDGYIECIRADVAGRVSMLLGAGRAKKDDEIDSSAGILFNVKAGSKVSKGDLVATLYTDRHDIVDTAAGLILEAISVSVHEPQHEGIIVM
jgi:pyrimidine-nucleoside phosphorylase